MPDLPKLFGMHRPNNCPHSNHQVCHLHEEVDRHIILFWSGVSVLFGGVVGAIIAWSSYSPNGYKSLLSLEQLEQLRIGLSKFGEIGDMGVVIGVLIIVAFWGLAVLFVCTRRFTSLFEYVVLALTAPAAVISVIPPLV